MNIYRESGKWYFAGMDNNHVVRYGPYAEPPRMETSDFSLGFNDNTYHRTCYTIRCTRARFIVSREWNKRTKNLTEIIYKVHG